MQVFHTAGVPPKIGRTIFPSMGCTEKRSAALRKIVAVYTGTTRKETRGVLVAVLTSLVFNAMLIGSFPIASPSLATLERAVRVELRVRGVLTATADPLPKIRGRREKINHKDRGNDDCQYCRDRNGKIGCLRPVGFGPPTFKDRCRLANRTNQS